MSVTGAPPASSVSDAAAAAGTATGPAQVVVVQVLASYGGDSVRNGLVQTLQGAAGPGGIVTGTVTAVRADGTFTLQTAAGPELLLHHPPELPLTVGSAVALRIVSVAPTPQVAILTVDGKLVSSQLTGLVGAPPGAGAPAAAQAPAPPTPTPVPAPASAPPATGGPALPPATLASTLVAAMSFEDEVAIEAALSGDGTLAPIASQPAGLPIAADARSIIATLVRPAPARLGSAPIPPGTRYLATVQIGGTDAEPAPATATATAGAGAPAAPVAPADPDDAAPPQAAKAAAAEEPATEADAAAPPAAPPAPPQTPVAAATPQPLDLSNFTALATTVAGRVLATPPDSETLVETPLGTLALPVEDGPPPTGAAIQLKIAAVAPPLPQHKPAADKPAPGAAPVSAPPLLQDAARALAVEVPALAQQIQAQLALPPTDQLTALILNFLGGLKREPTAPARWPDAPLRKALVDAGRSDLASRLDTEASQIGKSQPAPPGDWSVTVLPFLGLATTRPMRLYRRVANEEEREKGGGDRFVVELQLVRLGALQLDGLVRERRFDLVLRSEQPLDDGLRAIVEQTFRDTLLISGWSGELSYARTGAVPMVPLQPDGSGVGISA